MTNYKQLQNTLRNLREEGYDVQVKLNSKASVLLAELKRIDALLFQLEKGLQDELLATRQVEEAQIELRQVTSKLHYLTAKANPVEANTNNAMTTERLTVEKSHRLENKMLDACASKAIDVEFEAVTTTPLVAIAVTLMELAQLLFIALPLAVYVHVKQMAYEAYIDVTWDARYGFLVVSRSPSFVFLKELSYYLYDDIKLVFRGVQAQSVTLAQVCAMVWQEKNPFFAMLLASLWLLSNVSRLPLCLVCRAIDLGRVTRAWATVAATSYAKASQYLMNGAFITEFPEILAKHITLVMDEVTDCLAVAYHFYPSVAVRLLHLLQDCWTTNKPLLLPAA